jgi:hypothetical protein
MCSARIGENDLKKIPYFCTNCAKEVPSLEKLLFVESNNTKGFCSESCIMDFYKPYMNFLSHYEITKRESLDLAQEDSYIDIYSDGTLLDEVLNGPDEKLEFENDIGDKYFFQVKYLVNRNIYFAIICTYYNEDPSFIYFKIVTKYSELIDGFKELFSKTEDRSSFQHIDIPEDVLAQVNLKKSEQLALLLERKATSDIDFEKFALYDDYIKPTLEDADEVYEYEDDSMDTIATYIKSFKKQDLNFYYVVMCLQIDFNDQKGSKRAMLPILTFPSIDNELYTFYAVGKSLNTKIKN